MKSKQNGPFQNEAAGSNFSSFDTRWNICHPATQHLGLIMFNKYHQNFKSLLLATLVILPTAKKAFWLQGWALKENCLNSLFNLFLMHLNAI